MLRGKVDIMHAQICVENDVVVVNGRRLQGSSYCDANMKSASEGLVRTSLNTDSLSQESKNWKIL